MKYLFRYQVLSSGESREEEIVTVAGRIHAIRESGAKLIFYDLRGEGVKLQVSIIIYIFSYLNTEIIFV